MCRGQNEPERAEEGRSGRRGQVRQCAALNWMGGVRLRFGESRLLFPGRGCSLKVSQSAWVETSRRPCVCVRRVSGVLCSALHLVQGPVLDKEATLKGDSGTSLLAQWIRIHCQCRGPRFDPWSGEMPHATEQLSTLEPELGSRRSPHTATKSSPCPLRLENPHEQQRRPRTGKST